MLTATYRVVTPMFLGGADPTKEAELRLPSFKGALRFWWRAMMWGEIGDVAKLRQMEALLFGSTSEGQSRVLMRLSSPLTSTMRVDGEWKPSSWEQYTGYGIRDKGERCFIRGGHEWTVELNLRRCDAAQFDQVLHALKLVGLVGGLGSRSRKAWGSLTLVALDGAAWQRPSDQAAWRSAVDSLIVSSRSGEAPFTAFTNASRWEAGPVLASATVAQSWLGRRYQETVKGTEPKADRAQFGLPRQFAGSTAPRKERRGSPLMLHIHDCGNGKALPTALWLPSRFLADEPRIPGDGASARGFVQTLGSPAASSAR
jgi:CRISPR-associated protein Cmr1